MSRGAALIVKERDRQKREEGYTTEHDDHEHLDGDLYTAAMCYLMAVKLRDEPAEFAGEGVIEDLISRPPGLWPWQPAHWKPKDDIRDLVRAGALIAAEIDRRLRTRNTSAAPHPDLDPDITA